ncbi:MAG: hypothetical protein V4710_19210 [Verrucomicrobiota bacterium]
MFEPTPLPLALAVAMPSSSAVTLQDAGPGELTLVAGQFIFEGTPEGGGWDNGIRGNDQATDAYFSHAQWRTMHSIRGAIWQEARSPEAMPSRIPMRFRSISK